MSLEIIEHHARTTIQQWGAQGRRIAALCEDPEAAEIIGAITTRLTQEYRADTYYPHLKEKHHA